MADISSELVRLNNLAGNVTEKTADSKNKLNSDFTDFLKLLTTQLKNQDPLDPLDSNEFTSQLVGFSQLEQQLAQSEKLDALNALFKHSAVIEAANLVGKNVIYSGPEFTKSFDDRGEELEYTLAEKTDKITIVISDKDGSPVRTVELGPAEAGIHAFEWGGNDDNGNSALAGNYRISVQAENVDRKPITVEYFSPIRIAGVEISDEGIPVLKSGNVRFSLENVRSIEPDPVA